MIPVPAPTRSSRAPTGHCTQRSEVTWRERRRRRKKATAGSWPSRPREATSTRRSTRTPSCRFQTAGSRTASSKLLFPNCWFPNCRLWALAQHSRTSSAKNITQLFSNSVWPPRQNHLILEDKSKSRHHPLPATTQHVKGTQTQVFVVMASHQTVALACIVPPQPR